MNAHPEPKIQEADVVSEETQTSVRSQSDNVNAATVFADLENLIKSNITGISTRKNELKKLKEMLASALGNSETYRTHEQAAKEATKLKAATKSQILKEPANANLTEKVTGLVAEVKEMDGALSDYLREYQRLSGANEIESDDGEIHEIVYIAKLVKKSSRRK